MWKRIVMVIEEGVDECMEKKKKAVFWTTFFLFAREERLERPTLGFGDRCSTD
jgi:hypothetical protein